MASSQLSSLQTNVRQEVEVLKQLQTGKEAWCGIQLAECSKVK